MPGREWLCYSKDNAGFGPTPVAAYGRWLKQIARSREVDELCERMAVASEARLRFYNGMAKSLIDPDSCLPNA